MDRGAWLATVLGVTRVRHDLATKQQYKININIYIYVKLNHFAAHLKLIQHCNQLHFNKNVRKNLEKVIPAFIGSVTPHARIVLAEAEEESCQQGSR